MKITRRELAAGAVVSAVAPAQSPLAPPSEDEEELLKAARQRVLGNREALAKFPLPMATEPAFQFKA